MAWGWSHTQESYDYAEEQLGKLPREELIEIANEWTDYLARKKLHADDLSNTTIADWIWHMASSYEHGRTCSNGGGELYLCPHGCHTVDLSEMPKDWTPEEY